MEIEARCLCQRLAAVISIPFFSFLFRDADVPTGRKTQQLVLKFCRGFALFDSSGDEVALDGKQGELRGLAKVRNRGGGLSEFGGKCATHGVIEMIPFEHRALADVV